MQKDIIYWIWLSRLINTVKLSSIHKLLNIYKLPERIWKLTKDELINLKINRVEIEQILKMEYRQNIENYFYYMKKEKIQIITYYDEYYPEKLKNIEDAPIVIYAKGNIKILNKIAIGIVGCRLCSEYGKKISEEFAYNLSKKDIVIISGLARGIDTWAHIGCIKAKGETIAVLGSGIDMMYPPENKGIFEKIVETGGVIISEYIVGTKPEPNNFPKRNRIISGLSDGVLLIEAKKRSGSLITVDLALEQGKNVYAIPGDIYRKNSVGTNELIKQGAIPVTKVEDILEEL